MDLNTWREKRQNGEKYTLQDGLVVTLRRCDLMDLAEQGKVPTPLVDAANGLLSNTKTELNIEDFPQYAPVINLVARACIVDPATADTADEDHLCVEELPVVDRLAIYNWAVQGVQPLAKFREGAG